MMLTSAAIERHEGHRQRDRQGGFTLVEVVLALTIMGMLATIAVPYFRAGDGVVALRARGSQIASLLRRDRNMALHLQRRSTVAVDTQGGLVQSGLLGESIVMPKGLTLRLLPESARSVVFATDGSSSGARIVLASQRASVVIDVNRLTAAIRIAEAER